MTEKTETTWQCGRCNSVTVIEGTGQPESWSRLKLASPPRHSEPVTVSDLCPSCAAQIVRTAQGKAS